MQSRQPLQNPILVLWSPQEKRGPGRLSPAQALTSTWPFSSFFFLLPSLSLFFLSFLPLLLLLPPLLMSGVISCRHWVGFFFVFFLCGRSSGREPVCFPLRLFRRVDGHKGSWDLEQSALVKHVARITCRYQKTFQAGAQCGFSIKMELGRWFHFTFFFFFFLINYSFTASQEKK